MLEKLEQLSKVDQERLEPHIASLVDDVKPAVEYIENGPKTTKGHYGKYMDAFHQFGAAGDAVLIFITGCAMERAGGNRQGINDAARLVA